MPEYATKSPTASSNKVDHKSELHNLKDDLLAVKDDVSKVASSIMDQGRDVAGTIKEQTVDKFGQGVQSTRDFVKERPLTCAMVAAGAGLVLGMLMSRLSRR